VTAVAVAILLGFANVEPPRSFEASVPDGQDGVLIEVPFVAQGPLLCGGAAAAMVQRFWGARGVYGEDFGHLVRENEGGIRASELTSALQDRGYDVRVSQARPDQVLAALEDGVPPILLLESGATRLHYVVLVGLDGEVAWIHDPNFGPSRELALDELLRRWRASGFWAAHAVPSATTDDASGRSTARPPLPLAPGADAAASAAMARLRSGDFEGARVSASTLLRDGAAEAQLGRRIRATAWFLEGEGDRALQEWNALGEPEVDLVRIFGLEHTRYQVAERRISLHHGDVLHPSSLALARRRLAALPSIGASRIDYRPVVDGTVEVEAAVMERTRVPGFSAWVAQVPRGLLNRRLALEVGPILAQGERWRVGGSWERAQRYVGGSLSAPAPPFPGITTVSMEWRRERFGMAGDGTSPVAVTEHRFRGALGVQEWVRPRLRLGASLALESWAVPSWGHPAADDPRLVNAGLQATWMTTDDRAWITAGGEGWTGSGRSFARTSLEAGTRIPQGTWQEWRLRAGGTAVSREAPRMIWPGAGDGRTRAHLLRAHGLVEDDVIQGPAFGRELLYATAEHRVFGRVGPLRLGGSLFVDAVHAGSRGDGVEDRGFVDFGVGVFLDAGGDEVALSLARGRPGWRLSARVGGYP